MIYSSIVALSPGRTMWMMAGPSITIASIGGLDCGLGGSPASMQGTMSAFVPWNISPRRVSDGGVELISCENTLSSMLRPDRAALRICRTFPLSSFTTATSDLDFDDSLWLINGRLLRGMVADQAVVRCSMRSFTNVLYWSHPMASAFKPRQWSWRLL